MLSPVDNHQPELEGEEMTDKAFVGSLIILLFAVAFAIMAGVSIGKERSGSKAIFFEYALNECEAQL